MNVRECYEAIGGDYDDVMGRLISEKRVKKFALLFSKDSSMNELRANMEAGNYDEAFRAAHTLKGVCANLGFTALYNVSSEVTELLRAGNTGKAEQTMPQVEESYARTISGISQLE